MKKKIDFVIFDPKKITIWKKLKKKYFKYYLPFCDNNMILWEMAANLLTIGSF